MEAKKWFYLAVAAVILCGMIAGCQPVHGQDNHTTPTSSTTEGASLPNPATKFCLEQGYKHEIRTAADGSQSGVCVFPDGNECDEWAYFRGECGPESGSQ